MAESTQIRIDVDVKKNLEFVRDREIRLKTHSDAIEHLINYKMSAEKEIKELHATIREEIKNREQEEAVELLRKQQEDINLGVDRKNSLQKLTERLGLGDLNSTLDFLTFVFEKTETFDKSTLFYLSKL